MGLNVKCGVGRERGLQAVLLHEREKVEDEGKFRWRFVSQLEVKTKEINGRVVFYSKVFFVVLCR